MLTAGANYLKLGRVFNMTPERAEGAGRTRGAELGSAPHVPSAGLQGRCHFCGAVTRETVYVETTHDIERHRGVDCCGGGRFKLS